MLDLIDLCPGLGSEEVGQLACAPTFEHGEELVRPLTADQWLDVRLTRQALGRPLHWWELPTHE